MRELILGLKRFLIWHRRGLLLAAAILFAFAVLQLFAPPRPTGKQVLVAASDIPPGKAVSASQLHLLDVPASLVTAGTLTSLDEVVGKVPAVPVPAGTIISSAHLVTPKTVAPGHLLVPTRVSDSGVLSLIKPGDRVTLMTVSAAGEAQVLAQSVRVVAVPTQVDSSLASPDSSQGPLLLLEVSADAAPRVAAASMQRAISITLG